jgi:hypothetical protein
MMERKIEPKHDVDELKKQKNRFLFFIQQARRRFNNLSLDDSYMEGSLLYECSEEEINESMVVSESFDLSFIEIKEGGIIVDSNTKDSPIPERRSMRNILNSYKPSPKRFTIEQRAPKKRLFETFVYTTDVMSDNEVKKINYGLRTLCKSFGIYFTAKDSFLEFSPKDEKSIIGWEQTFSKLLVDYDLSAKDSFLKLASSGHYDVCFSITSLFFATAYFQGGTLGDSELTQTVRGHSWIYQLASEYELSVDGDNQTDIPCWDEKVAYDVKIGKIRQLPFFFMEKKPSKDAKGYLEWFSGFDVIRILATLRLHLNMIVTESDYTMLKHISDIEKVVRMGWVVGDHKLLVWIMRVKMEEKHKSKIERYIRRFEATPIIIDLSTASGAITAYFLLRKYIEYERERIKNLASCARFKSRVKVISNDTPQMSIPDTLTLVNRSGNTYFNVSPEESPSSTTSNKS